MAKSRAGSKSNRRKVRRSRRKPQPGKSQYTVSQLSSKSHKTIRGFISDIEHHVPEIDSLKEPSDAWGFEIFGYKSYQLYGSIDQVATKLREYKIAEEHPKKALRGVKVIRVKGVDFSQWQKDKAAEVEETVRNRKLKGKKFKQYKRQAESREKKLKAEIKKLKAKLRKDTSQRKKAQRKKTSKRSKRK